MNLTKYAIEKKPLTLVLAFILTVGGVGAFFNLGQLEDPDFTVKQAVIVTPYPGASPSEVELEISDRIESAIQEMKELKFIESISWPGLSVVKAEIDPTVWGDKLPQIWDELRRKIQKAELLLPPGSGKPQVYDDFGDVYGFQLVLVGDGFTYAEMEQYAKDLRKQLLIVPGVARIDLVGVQQQAVYLNVAPAQLSQLGISEQSIQATVHNQNTVVDGGGVNSQNSRFRIAPTGEFQRPEDIADLVIRPSLADALQKKEITGSDTQLLRLGDIAEVKRGYLDPPTFMVRWNGLPAIGLSITNKLDVDVVDVGANLDEALEKLDDNLPYGIELRKMNWQADAVTEAVDHFLFKFVLTVAIVLLVVWLAMGWRVAVIIGTGLIITVFGTFLFMLVMDIDLHRLSLGALVIALVMMVDNAIVVADGAIIRVQRGMERTAAAIEAAVKPSRKLLGATIIGSVAFFPIFLSRDDTGEYCQALFPVIAAALLLSWLVSVTFTPLQCAYMLPEKTTGKDPYGGTFYNRFRTVIRFAIAQKWVTTVAITGLLIFSLANFGKIPEMFFPQSTMAKFMVDYWMPEGTRIEQVSDDLLIISDHLLADERVKNVTTFVGGGSPRFYLPVEPADNNPSYGYLVVDVKNFKEIENIFADLAPWFLENFPDAMVPLRRFPVGPGKNWEFEIRLSAPPLTTTEELRTQGQRILDIVQASPVTGFARQDWRNYVQIIVPHYSQSQGNSTGVTRDDLAKATKRAFDGRIIGVYRDGDNLLPILLQDKPNQKISLTNFGTLPIKPIFSTDAVPLTQVTDGTETKWVDPFHLRYNRLRTIRVQANPAPTVLLSEMRQDMAEAIFALDLPEGWSLSWGGITEKEIESQKALIPGVVPAITIIILVLIWLFNSFRPAIIVLLIAPLALVGMVSGLLLTNTPFGFMALLGAMGLSGMMMKNAIVLLDEIKQNRLGGMSKYLSIQEAAVARLRAVVVTATKIALGLMPMLTDAFWAGLAVTVIFGISIGAVLTLIGVPVLYSVFYKVHSESDMSPATSK